MILLFSDEKLHFYHNTLSVNILPTITIYFSPLVNCNCTITKLHLSFLIVTQL
jgi:hypothetical protein